MSRTLTFRPAGAAGPRGWVSDARALAAPTRISAEDASFPRRLAELGEKHPLWIQSCLSSERLDREVWRSPAAAIVGSRTASAVGRELARDLAWGLAQRGVCIVSGLARGIDAAAHEGALQAGGRTVAVLACGLDRPYPPEHTGLARDVAEHGALVTEWSAGTPPEPWRFPRRNRLISGLADVVVLVEGGGRSGALHTVRYALEQGRDVCAVPREPILPGSRAPNRLLREGAVPVTSAAEICDHLARLWGAPGGSRFEVDRDQADARVEAVRNVDNVRTAVAAVLRRQSRVTVEGLAALCPGADAAGLLAVLMQMEVEDRIRPDGRGGWRSTGM